MATLVITILPAKAAVPTIAGPDRVFTFPNVPLAFTGTELLAAPKSKTITITAEDIPMTPSAARLRAWITTSPAAALLGRRH